MFLATAASDLANVGQLGNRANMRHLERPIARKQKGVYIHTPAVRHAEGLVVCCSVFSWLVTWPEPIILLVFLHMSRQKLANQ